MNWLVKMFLTKSRVKGWIHDGIAAGAKSAKSGNAEKLATYAGMGEKCMTLGSKVCEIVKDGDYSDRERAELDPYVDKAADAILGFFK